MTTIARCKHSRHALGLLSALLVCLMTASPAHADAGSRIIQRCTHGQSLSGFSQSAYRQALQEIPTEVQQYTNCDQLIRNAQLAATGGGATGGGVGGGTTGGHGATASPTGSTGAAPGAPLTPLAVTPAEQHSLDRASSAPSAPVRVGSKPVQPGLIHANLSSALSSLPAPLIAVIVFMIVAAATAVAIRLRRGGLPALRRSRP